MVTCKWTISMAPIMTWFILYILLSFPGTTTARAAEGGQRKGNAQADEAGRGTKPHEHSHGVDGEEFGFDHDAFLGPEEAKRFDELTTEESKTRLGRIVDKIDGDGDGQVTKAELSTWISRTRRRHTTNEARKRFKDYDQKGKGGITWSDYVQSTQALDVNSPDSTPSPTSVIGRRLAREGRRFKAADSDGDGIITAAEFTAFIYPDDFLHMGEITLEETIEDLDKNKDGFVEEEEYISDLRGSSGLDLAAEKREREIFREDRDVDRDGKLSLEELRQWVLPPPNYDFALAETNHLIRETDQDKDGKLTKPEILQSWNVFVGSQATNYGHDLTAKHDEL